MEVSKDIAVLPRSDDADTAENVRDELARILAHEQFKDTTRLKRFLTYVVEEALAGRSDRLKGYSVGVEVFDRPDSFDPQADTIVRVQAGQLRRRLDLYYSRDGQSNTMRILLPKGSYVPVFEHRQAALPAPDGSNDAQALNTSPLEMPMASRPRIYVPTFDDLSLSKDHTHFAQGLTAEVINALVQFRYLRVIAGTGTVTTVGRVPLDAMKDRFGADFVLSGNVRRHKDLVRVSINLIATETGEHVMTKIFDRECTPESLFEIQEEIASYTAANVGAPFGAVNRFNRREPKGLRANMRGYNALLKFYNMGLDNRARVPRELLEEFKVITENAPLFSSGWAAQSLLHTFFVGHVAPNTGYQAHMKDALRCAHKAVTTDPENSLGFFAQFMAAFHAGDFKLYRASAAQALALNPNDYNMLMHYAVTLAMQGKTDIARAYAASAHALIGMPPLWFYSAEIVCAFDDEAYDDVLSVTTKLSASGLLVMILFRISAAGLAGEIDNVTELRDAVQEFQPDAFEDIYKTLKVWHPTEKLYARVERGLQMVLDAK